ncbi:probable RNA-binding protein 19 [Episyrphus balteatus]|uniref:probable RNA-binding protein 19 n=1 Tax=Episyrphus balteatus TaxID=286459 RepID=UPI002485B1B8|nr:probable RNA-binding protein 19 [Episyrphus balteatus]
MSRVIVKNLPKKITEKKLRDLFEAQGTITDIQLKYTKEGVFRQFAFIGFRSEDEAQSAIKYFDNSCIQTNRIRVETCAALGAEEKPQSWSKHAKDSNSFRKAHGIDEKERAEKEEEYLKEKKKSKKVSKFDEIIGEHKDDPQFVEFMQAHDKNRTLWANDAEMKENGDKGNDDDEESNKERKVKKEKVESKKIKEEIEDEDEEDDDDEDEEEDDDKKLAEKPISDLEYMKSLVKSSDSKTPIKKDKKDKSRSNLELFTIKIHNVPYKARRQEVIKFFKPLKPYSVRLPSKVHGFCYIGFKTEKDFNTAMLKNKSFIKGKQVFFSDFTEKNKISKAKVDNTPLPTMSGKHLKWQEQEESIKNEENISESGKIFFRNLAYTVVDDDLQKLFEKYGPVAELDLPVDSITRKIKGFGTVTFVMPEHAVQAFSELDGTTFHGRLLHLIPGKTFNRDEEEDGSQDEGLSWKEKKEKQLKKAAQQTHNWNSLFLGANAVADILARQYETTKENILDSQTGGSSAAVRLALGETQIVMEMKQFLEENGVNLDVFESQTVKRSKTIMLAKNLPADTEVYELQPLFAQYGPIARFVFPPSGVTALIEYTDASEARTAFKKLAYSKFKHVPLYLEWAPEGTFKNEAPTKVKEEIKKEKKSIVDEVVSEKKTKKQLKKEDKERRERELLEEQKRKEEEEKAEKAALEKAKKEDAENYDEMDDDEPPEPDTTLFLRNLNFNTREDAVRNHFKQMGQIHMVQVAMRKDPEDPRNKMSLGYGFIQFKKNSVAEKTLRQMQFTQIEGNQVELKRSDRTLKVDAKAATARKVTKGTKQNGTKILVRNIPFQAKPNEVRDIFKAFGEIRTLRLPLKMTPGEESHRGFGFVDFITKSDAKKAFDALSQSTHLYGRRLVLEWASTTEENVGELRKRTAQTYQRSDVKKSKKGLFDMETDNNNEEDQNEEF